MKNSGKKFTNSLASEEFDGLRDDKHEAHCFFSVRIKLGSRDSRRMHCNLCWNGGSLQRTSNPIILNAITVQHDSHDNNNVQLA
jgi:hypothetical protein